MSISLVRLAGNASYSWQSSIGEYLEYQSLLLLYSNRLLGLIVTLINLSYLISNYITSGLVSCIICLAGMIVKQGCFFIKLTVSFISIRIVILFSSFILSLSLKIVQSKFLVFFFFYFFQYAFLIAISFCILGSRVSKSKLLTNPQKDIEYIVFTNYIN